MIPIIIFMIPIIAILTAHQRKMAEIIHGRQGVEPEMLALREDVRQLRDQVARLTLAIDDRQSARLASSTEVRQRIGEP